MESFLMVDYFNSPKGFTNLIKIIKKKYLPLNSCYALNPKGVRKIITIPGGRTGRFYPVIESLPEMITLSSQKLLSKRNKAGDIL